MFRLVLFTITTLLAGLATGSDNPFFPGQDDVFCYDIALQHDGIYILTYSTEGNPQCCGGNMNGSMNNGDDISLQLAPGAILKLGAMAGRNTEVVADQNGTIRCSGAPLIGFDCSWREE